MSDFKVNDTVELLNEGKPTGIRGAVVQSWKDETAVSVAFPFNPGPSSTYIHESHLRRVEPDFVVQPGDMLNFVNCEGAYYASYFSAAGRKPDASILRVWRKVDDTTMKIVWERES
jgi:hypothetical protein